MYYKRRRTRWQVFAVLALVLAMLFSVGWQTIYAAGSHAKGSGVKVNKLDGTPELPEAGKKPHGEKGEDALYKDDDQVVVIVEMEDKPLIEDASMTKSTDAGLSLTNKGQNRKNSLLERQAEVHKKITDAMPAGKGIEIRNHYTLLMNGFSARIEYGQLDTIRGLPGVKAAYVAPVYIIEPDAVSSGEMVGVGDVWNSTGFRGQGMRIAIIDSGIDVDHELFRDAPEDPSVNIENIRETLANVDLQAKLMAPNVTAEDIYLSDKIPFAFNYADGVADADHHGGDTHGTHVAGIAAGNDGVHPDVIGMAPEAQLYIMKAASGSALYFDAVLTALEDCVMLDVDVVNMSLGSAAGFTESDGITSMDGVYSRLGRTGIFLATSAGNSYNSGYRNLWKRDFPLAGDPDNGIVGMPSSFAESTSVASVDNKTYMSNYFDVNGRKVAYEDYTSANSQYNFLTLADQPLIYVPVPNGGAAEDYEGLEIDDWSVAPKVALVQRGGGLSFQEKHDNAVAAGAYAMVVYNNESNSWIVMQIERQSIPAVFIPKADGEYMLEQEDKQLTVKEDLCRADYPFAGEMSDFSSWGTTGDLRLKPEIAAPGGNVYSSVDGNGYKSMSGTSMSSPNVAGLAALVKQYLMNDERFTDLPEEHMREMINTLLMSTAIPASYEDEFFGELPYSPRQQGAGMANVNNAVRTNAYLSVPGMTRPKLELGDDPEETGVYELVFNVHNFGSETLSYNIEPTVMTEFTDYDDNAIPYMAGTPNPLYPEVETNWDGDMVVVPAGETKQVVVKLTLSEGDRELFTYCYENGMYVDGFVFLKSLNEDGIDLSMPFLGFYGDWTKAPQLDHGFYWDTLLDENNNNATRYPHEASVAMDEFYLYYLGDNMHHYVEYLQDRNAISPNGDGNFDSLAQVYTSLLRNAKTFRYTIEGEDGTEYYSLELGEVSKTYYHTNTGRTDPVGANGWDGIDPWHGTDKNGVALPNNAKAIVRMEATLDFDKHESANLRSGWEFPITIDLEAPEVISYDTVEKDGVEHLRIEVGDNQYIADVSTYAYVNGMVDFRIESFPGEAQEPGQNLTFDLNIENQERILLVVTDYAYNETAYEIEIPKEGFYVEPSSASLYVEEQRQLSAALYLPETGNENVLDEPVEWSSSDDAIATVTENGLVTAISAGEAAITAKTPSGLSDSCAVTVKEMADKPALIINKDVYFGQYEQNANDEDGKEPIQWRVLSNDGDNVLLLSERILDIHAFMDWHGELRVPATWEDSDVRGWMNGEFFEKMFSAAERPGVADSLVEAHANPDYPTVDQGSDTRDKVFLLSFEEAMRTDYGFANSPEESQTRVALMTPSVLKYLEENEYVSNQVFWILRTMGINPEHITYVNPFGGLSPAGAMNVTGNTSIRPAFNLDLSKVAFTSDAKGKPQDIGALTRMGIPDGAVKISMYHDGQSVQVTNDIPEVIYAGGEAVVDYTGATVGENQFVSVTITGTNGQILYYGKMAKSDSDSAASGSFSVPTGMLKEGTYSLNVFAEQDNGESLTDFVSQMQSFVFEVRDEEGTTPTPGQPTPTPGQPTPTPEPEEPPKAGGISLAIFGAVSAAAGLFGMARRKRRK